MLPCTWPSSAFETSAASLSDSGSNKAGGLCLSLLFGVQATWLPWGSFQEELKPEGLGRWLSGEVLALKHGALSRFPTLK